MMAGSETHYLLLQSTSTDADAPDVAADRSTAVVAVAGVKRIDLECCCMLIRNYVVADAADPDHHRRSGSSVSLLLLRCCN